MMFLRDRLALSTKRTYTDEGFLVVPSRISRVGIQEYFAVEMGLQDEDPSKVVRVYRPPEEVFKEDSLNSFANKPVTDDHPPELVNASNFKNYAVGYSGNEISKDGMFVDAKLHITDADAIKKVEQGKVELSNGYTADIEWTSGVTSDGEEFDAIQKNIKGNHIAIVEKGRAGPSCKISDKLPENPKEETYMKIVIDGVSYEVTEQVAEAYKKVDQRLKDAEKEKEEMDEELEKKKKEMDEAEEENKKTTDSLKAQLDSLKEKIPNTKTMDSKIKERMNIVYAASNLVQDYKWEGKDNETILKEVVAAKCPNVQLDSVSNDYLKARFDMLVEDLKTTTNQNLDDVFTNIVSKTVTDEEVDNRPEHLIARDKMIERNRDLWKSKEKK